MASTTDVCEKSPLTVIDVNIVSNLERAKSRIAVGPDGISGRVLISSVKQPSPVSADIFGTFLAGVTILLCVKTPSLC